MKTKDDKPNVPNRYGETTIYLAAHQGHSEIVIILSPLTGDPNTSDNDGKTPIHWAARHGHTDIWNLSKRLTNRMLEIQHSTNRNSKIFLISIL